MADDLLNQDDLFHLRDPQLPPMCGSVLLAKPTMDDPTFSRTVVLMIDHNEEGSLGLIMNKPTTCVLSEVLEGDAPLLKPLRHLRIWFGGPVSVDSLFVVHTLPPDVVRDAYEIQPGIYLNGADFDNATFTESNARVILSYSGWAAGQLQDEINRDDWAVVDGIGADILFSNDHSAMWEECVRRLPSRYRLWLNIPRDFTGN